MLIWCGLAASWAWQRPRPPQQEAAQRDPTASRLLQPPAHRLCLREGHRRLDLEVPRGESLQPKCDALTPATGEEDGKQRRPLGLLSNGALLATRLSSVQVAPRIIHTAALTRGRRAASQTRALPRASPRALPASRWAATSSRCW